MERTWRVVGDDVEIVISGVRQPEWTTMDEPCPECGTREFRHVSTGGGRYGLVQETVALRSDYWDATKPLLTRCLGCDVVLYKHPAYDLRFGSPETETACLDF